MTDLNYLKTHSRRDSLGDAVQKIYLAGFLILAVTLAYYQVINGDYYRRRAENNYVRLLPIRSLRGLIQDRRGEVLAHDKAAFNISVIPYQIHNYRRFLFDELSRLSGYSVEILEKNYKKNFNAHFAPVNLIENIDKSLALEIKEALGDYVLINVQPQRDYPYGNSCSHILGYVREGSSLPENFKKYGYSPIERIGFLGIEQYYDTYLRGEDGGDLIEVDSLGKVVGYLGKRIPTKGKDIQLTIDSRLQNVAHRVMEKERGVVILMDADTGAILTFYSSPSFDPNSFINKKGVDRILNDTSSPLLNRGIQATYPTGSTFKPLLAVGALEEGKIKASTTFSCPGEYKIGSTVFRCAHIHWEENLYEGLAHSCNVYFYNVGMLLGAEDMSKWAKKFGLDSLTGIDLPYEKKGLVPGPEWKRNRLNQNWYPGDTLNLAIGQGFLNVTPLEILVALNSIGNGGFLVKPYLLKKIGDTDSQSISKEYLGVSKNSLESVKKGLWQAVHRSDGTARPLRRLNLGIYGKTGTAQTQGKSHGWFVGFFSRGQKKYSFCVFLEHGGSSYRALQVTESFLGKITSEDYL
ncbi:MAG: penicillin-binding protein 2 [Candidatus Omnitrophica bacterium]|nr:penicillin-binding protein 2 [Candidatus Omnitrophota bacterium]